MPFDKHFSSLHTLFHAYFFNIWHVLKDILCTLSSKNNTNLSIATCLLELKITGISLMFASFSTAFREKYALGKRILISIVKILLTYKEW